MIGVLDLFTCLLRKAAATKAYGVQADQSRAIARDHREGGGVERKHRPTRRHRRLPHPRMLMKPSIRTEPRKIIDLRVAPEPTEAGDDGVISDLAIVADMRAVHDVIVVTDSRTTAPTLCTHVDRDLFPNLCSLTNLEPGRLTAEGLVLWFGSQACVGEDSTIRANLRSTEQRDVGTDLDSTSEFDLAPNEGKRTDLHSIGKDRSAFDACGRMDIGQRLSPFRYRS